MIDSCKSCDARGFREKEENFQILRKDCSVCNGTGIVKTSKGKRRIFRKKIDDDTENNSVEAQTQKFLRAHGY